MTNDRRTITTYSQETMRAASDAGKMKSRSRWRAVARRGMRVPWRAKQVSKTSGPKRWKEGEAKEDARYERGERRRGKKQGSARTIARELREDPKQSNNEMVSRLRKETRNCGTLVVKPGQGSAD